MKQANKKAGAVFAPAFFTSIFYNDLFFNFYIGGHFNHEMLFLDKG